MCKFAVTTPSEALGYTGNVLISVPDPKPNASWVSYTGNNIIVREDETNSLNISAQLPKENNSIRSNCHLAKVIDINNSEYLLKLLDHILLGTIWKWEVDSNGKVRMLLIYRVQELIY